MSRDWTRVWIKAMVGLSLFDAFCTDVGIKLGWVTEANPIAKAVYEWHVPAFYGWKLALPILLLLLYPALPPRRLHKGLIQTTVLLYLAVGLYHCFWVAYGSYVYLRF